MPADEPGYGCRVGKAGSVWCRCTVLREGDGERVLRLPAVVDIVVVDDGAKIGAGATSGRIISPQLKSGPSPVPLPGIKGRPSQAGLFIVADHEPHPHP